MCVCVVHVTKTVKLTFTVLLDLLVIMAIVLTRLSSIIIILLSISVSNVSMNNDNIIKLNTHEFTNIELKSIFDLHATTNSGDDIEPSKHVKQKNHLFWWFSRFYFDDIYNRSSLANNNRLMIALDNDVQVNLKSKYSIVDNYNFNLLIKNLTYMDSGFYFCEIWNQKSLVYELVVNSKFLIFIS